MLYNKDQIKQIIPYSEPFLWVDEVQSIEGDEIVGYKQTDKNDDYFKGHFTDFPIMPGVLTIEGLAQTATILLRQKIVDEKNKHLLAYQVRSAIFYAPILPGDKIRYRAQLLGFYENKIANFIGEAYAGEEKKCEARFSIAVIDKKEMKDKFLGEKKSLVGKLKEWAHLPPLQIGKWSARLPIIQGGMGVRVSLHKLAGAVAKEGGVGIISVSGMTDVNEAKEEIRKARAIAGPGGVIGINIMGVVGKFTELVKASLEEGIDLIIQGAGFRTDIFELAREKNVPVFSMASSVKVAQKAQEAGASAIVVEGADAGGHLGFPHGKPFRKTLDILKEVVVAVKIPVIAAGGIFDGKDIVEMLRAGASGVQMATRFVATEECDADIKFKEAYVNAKQEDIVIIKSPVGLPGRAIRTPLVEKMLAGTAPKADPVECKGCIGPICDKSYCILKVLEYARLGDLANGLVFAGSNVWRIDKITTVKELMEVLVQEANQILGQQPLLLPEKI